MEAAWELYAYCENTPIALRDAAGLQSSSDDPVCCECESARWVGGDDGIGFDPKFGLPFVPGTMKGGQRRFCLLNIECHRNGCGRRGLPGFTGVPRRVHGNVWKIDICISCRVSYDSIHAVIDHELIHAKRFCSTGKWISSCLDCKKEERTAYRKSCEGSDDFKRCVACGVYLSCAGHKTKYGRPCVKEPDIGKPCTYADIDLIMKDALR